MDNDQTSQREKFCIEEKTTIWVPHSSFGLRLVTETAGISNVGFEWKCKNDADESKECEPEQLMALMSLARLPDPLSTGLFSVTHIIQASVSNY